MVWAILVVAAIFFLIMSPGFRVFALLLAGAAGVVLFMIVQTDNKRAEEYRAAAQQQQTRDNAAWFKVRPEQMELRGISFTPSYRIDTKQAYTVDGSVKNNANETITKLALAVIAYDCPTGVIEYSGCDVIGRATADLPSEIPAGEVRAVRGTVEINNLAKPAGELRLTYTIARVRTQW
jgi:hypothetical protein